MRLPTLRVPSPLTGMLLGSVLLGPLAFGACGSVGLDPAPDFQFSVYQGEEVLGAEELSLSDLRGKPVVLNFWAGLCPPCRAEMPDLQAFYDSHRDKVVLFGLDVGPFTALGSRKNAQELLRQLEITYPTGFSSTRDVVIQYRVLGMPTTFFITPDGNIFARWDGLLDEAKLTEITEAMLASTGGGAPSGEAS